MVFIRGSGDEKKQANRGALDRSERSNGTDLSDMWENVGHRDAVYLFACHLEWRSRRSLAGYQELLAALDDPNCEIRNVAEVLLSRRSPRPQLSETTVEGGKATDWLSR